MRLAVLCLLASPALADVSFTPMHDALPQHVYSGGWEHFVGGGLAVFDCNDDGLPDLFAAGGSSRAQLMVNRSAEALAFDAAPLPDLTATTGAYPLDMNGDGVLDLYVMRVGVNQILTGFGNCTFTASPDTVVGDSWTTAMTAWWETGDTIPTLAIGNYVDRTNPEGPFEACDDNLLRRPNAVSPLTPGFCPLSMLAARDARGRSTLRISNDRHYYVRSGYEQMWDIQDARFLTQDDGWFGPKLWGMGIASRDLNGDARDEVMLTSMGDQLLQLASPDGTYIAAPFDIGTYAQRPHIGDDGRPSTGWHAQFGDVDNDGRADLFIAKGNVDQMPGNAMEDPNNLLIQGADGRFTEAAAALGLATTKRSRGAALVDLNKDGLLDLAVINRRAPMELYQNTSTETGAWLGVSLVRQTGNRFEVGAVVTVTTELGAETQQLSVGGGHAGGQLVPLHFGLGAATTAKVQVEFPDATLQTYTVDALNQTLTLTRD
jgi:hypothetical protein